MWDWNTYFIFGFSCVWSVLFLRRYSLQTGKWHDVVLAFFPLFFLHAFRAETVGVDLINYAKHVENGIWVFSDIRESPFELLSKYLCFISHKWGGMHTFLFLTSLLEYVFLFIAMRELKKRGISLGLTFVVMFSYVILRSVSMVRNGIALSAALCAVLQLFDRQKLSQLKYWLFSAIALGFHNSAVLLVPMYYICRPLDIHDNRRKLSMLLRFLIMLVIFLLLFYLGSSGFLEIFFSVTGDMYDASHFEARHGWGFGNLAVRLPFLLLVVFSINKITKRGYDYLPFLLMLLFDILISQTKYISQDLERLTMYSGLSEVVLWGVLYSAYVKKNKNAIKISFWLVGFAYYTYYMYFYSIRGAEGNGLGIMPYHTWFDFL